VGFILSPMLKSCCWGRSWDTRSSVRSLSSRPFVKLRRHTEGRYTESWNGTLFFCFGVGRCDTWFWTFGKLICLFVFFRCGLVGILTCSIVWRLLCCWLWLVPIPLLWLRGSCMTRWMMLIWLMIIYLERLALELLI